MHTRLQFTIANGLPVVQRAPAADERAVAVRLGTAVLLGAPLAETVAGVLPAHPLLLPAALAAAVAGTALAVLTLDALRRERREHADALAYLRQRATAAPSAPAAVANVRTDASPDPRDVELAELAVRFLDAHIAQHGRNDKRIVPYRALTGWNYGNWRKAVNALGNYAVSMPGHGTRLVGTTSGELREMLASGARLPYRSTPAYDPRRIVGNSKQ